MEPKFFGGDPVKVVEHGKFLGATGVVDRHTEHGVAVRFDVPLETVVDLPRWPWTETYVQTEQLFREQALELLLVR